MLDRVWDSGPLGKYLRKWEFAGNKFKPDTHTHARAQFNLLTHVAFQLVHNNISCLIPIGQIFPLCGNPNLKYQIMKYFTKVRYHVFYFYNTYRFM